MTTVAYDLGAPPAAAQRGGDCRARDLGQGRNVHGPHRFASTTHCRINNGLLRLTVGASGAAPSLTIEARRGSVATGDVYGDVYGDIYGGSMTAPAWFAMGTLTIDSPSVAALLTAVRIAHVTAEEITIRLVAPLMADAFVTLKRGRRHVGILHGDTRANPLVDVDRRIRWTASPSPTGTASTGRVEEETPVVEGFPRFLASVDPVTVDAGAFSLTAASVTSARLGAGVGTYGTRDRPADHHREMGDASRSRLVVT